jgi:hypothetical protein
VNGMWQYMGRKGKRVLSLLSPLSPHDSTPLSLSLSLTLSLDAWPRGAERVWGEQEE